MTAAGKSSISSLGKAKAQEDLSSFKLTEQRSGARTWNETALWCIARPT